MNMALLRQKKEEGMCGLLAVANEQPAHTFFSSPYLFIFNVLMKFSASIS